MPFKVPTPEEVIAAMAADQNTPNLVAKLKARVEEERLAYRVERRNRGDAILHAGRADGLSEALELLGEPFDPLMGKPWLW